MCSTAVSGNLPLISCTGEEPQFQEKATIKHLSRSYLLAKLFLAKIENDLTRHLFVE